MDQTKIGNFIRSMRMEHGWTQQQLADKMGISDKAVSKWERGLGAPDISLIPDLSEIFGVESGILLSGEWNSNEQIGGNMKKLKFYVCPHCGNLLTATGEAAISCCGKKLAPLLPVKAEESDKLSIEKIEGDYFISSNHEMTKEHYITFVAFLTGDSALLRKQYPEWDLQVRIPFVRHGMLLWHCSMHGLQYQNM